MYSILENKGQIYIITGGPGFGKSVLAENLRVRGYAVGSEAAREIIMEQKHSGGTVLPDTDMRSFSQEVFKRRLAFFQSVDSGEIAFCDRAIPDQLAFARYFGLKTHAELEKNVLNYRYNQQVFITPPWKEIYQNDDIRRESFDEAVAIHQAIEKVYLEYGYQLIRLPMTGIKQRVEFILNLISVNK